MILPAPSLSFWAATVHLRLRDLWEAYAERPGLPGVRSAKPGLSKPPEMTFLP